MRILITGAHGFVGQHLCSYLKTHKQMDVVPVGRDWQEPQHWHNIDAVVHLAAKVHDMQGGDPKDYVENNVGLTLQIAERALQAGVKRFVFMSSIKAMGEERATPYQESDTPKPVDPYGISKLAAEAALFELAQKSLLEVVVIRPPLVYGPGVRANFLALIKLVHKGLPLPLKSVRNLRSFIYVENLCDLVATCLTHPKAPGEVFLAADDSTFSTAGLIRELAHAMDKKPKLLPCPVFAMKGAAALLGKKSVVSRLVDSLALDAHKSRQRLGWNPPVSVADAMLKTVTWARQQLL